MKKLLYSIVWVIVFLFQISFTHAQANQVVYSKAETFSSPVDPNVSFTIQVQKDEYTVALTSETSGKLDYVLTATVINLDGLDKTFVPNVKQGLITSVKKSNLFFDKLTPDREYRLLIVGRKASDQSAPVISLGDYSFFDSVEDPDIVDNLVIGNSSRKPLPPPEIIDPQKNLYTDYTTPITQSATTTSDKKDTSLVGGLVTCGRFQGDTKCGLEELFNLVNRLIKFVIQNIFFPIFIFAVFYLGYTFLTSGGSTTAWAKAKKMATNMALGVLMILCAWLIVYVALTTLGATDATTYFQK